MPEIPGQFLYPLPWWWHWFFKKVPHPAEIPVDFLARPVIEEVIKVRDRIHLLENEALRSRIGGGALAARTAASQWGVAGAGRPYPPEIQEFPLPEIAEIVPPEIAEIAEIVPNEIAEIPVPDFVTSAIERVVDKRLNAFSEQILKEIRGLQDQIKQVKKA